MTKNKSKNAKEPDFKELTDRVIAKSPSTPIVGVRTNLDEEDPEKFNPYTRENHSFFER